MVPQEEQTAVPGATWSVSVSCIPHNTFMGVSGATRFFQVNGQSYLHFLNSLQSCLQIWEPMLCLSQDKADFGAVGPYQVCLGKPGMWLLHDFPGAGPAPHGCPRNQVRVSVHCWFLVTVLLNLLQLLWISKESKIHLGKEGSPHHASAAPLSSPRLQSTLPVSLALLVPRTHHAPSCL